MQKSIAAGKNRPEHSPELQIIVRQPSPISVGFEPVVKGEHDYRKYLQKQRLPHEETGISLIKSPAATKNTRRSTNWFF